MCHSCTSRTPGPFPFRRRTQTRGSQTKGILFVPDSCFRGNDALGLATREEASCFNPAKVIKVPSFTPGFTLSEGLYYNKDFQIVPLLR